MVNSMSSAISNVFSSRITTMVVKDQPIEKLSELLIRIGRNSIFSDSIYYFWIYSFGKAFIHFGQAMHIWKHTILPYIQ